MKNIDCIMKKCPEKFNEFVGRKCIVSITDVLLVQCENDGLKTSKILNHNTENGILTITTQSGSVYEFELRK